MLGLSDLRRINLGPRVNLFCVFVFAWPVAMFFFYDEGHRHCQLHHRTANPQGVLLAFFIAMVVSPSV